MNPPNLSFDVPLLFIDFTYLKREPADGRCAIAIFTEDRTRRKYIGTTGDDLHSTAQRSLEGCMVVRDVRVGRTIVEIKPSESIMLTTHPSI